MTTFARQIADVFLSWMLLACLSGCSTTTRQPPPEPPAEGPGRIGTLRTIGDHVFRNQRRAGDGERVYEGDTVSTGEASSAIIELDGGGFVQLAENTDPEFKFKVVSDGRRRCVYLYIKFGRVWVDSDVVCFETPDGGGIINSVVNIEVAPGSTIVTVFEGTVLITSPQEQALGAGEQVLMARGGIESARRLSSRELDAVAQWRDQIPDQRWCCSRNGKVFFGTEADCRRAGGELYRDQREAEERCRVEGWCCSRDGKVFFGTEADCRRAGGELYRDQREAEERCRVEGWCCSRDGKVFFGMEADCRRASGELYRDQREAEARCRKFQSEEPDGWCCSSSREVFPGTPESCAQKRATFYKTESQARQACEAREGEGYCCNSKGRVFFTTEKQCASEGGKLYKTQKDAANDRNCQK
ncbi:MAG TPA: hypothetical protein VF179_29935 [Thermoanaerobaculia bacterium]|nr:hypothetical protein [Thermoanaerobaculia bacterium]